MNKRTLLSILPAAALLLLSACTQDEPGGQGNELPYGEYPLQISGVTLDVESSAEPWSTEEPQTRVAENDNGTGSVWQWDGSEKIRVQLGDETADYTLNVDPILTADKQLYWTSTAPATVTARYPTDETVNLSDQSNALAYVLKAEAPNATYNNEITLSFKHQLAKVRVVLSGTQASLAQSVEVYGYTTCTNNEGVPTAGSTQGWLKMKNTTYADGTECWEANVVPGTIDLANFIRLNGHAVVEKDNLTDVPEVLNAAKMYTINLTVGEKITDIKDNTTINDNGYYRVSGTFNQQINITGGKPTIYLKDANINVSDGPAINIIGGNPTIHVIGANNTVSTSDGAGIYVAPGSSVTIEGNSRENDILEAHADRDGAGIGGSGWENYTNTCGDIIIRNVTVKAYGHGSMLTSPGIGSYGTCGNISIDNALVYAHGGLNDAPAIGSKVGDIPTITINSSVIHAYRGGFDNSSPADWIGKGSYTADGIHGDIRNSIIHKFLYDYFNQQTIAEGTVEYDANGISKEQS